MLMGVTGEDNIMCIPKTSGRIIKCGDFVTPIVISELKRCLKTTTEGFRGLCRFCALQRTTVGFQEQN